MVLANCVEWPHPVLLGVQSRRHQFWNRPRDMPRDLPGAVLPDTLIQGGRDTVLGQFVLRLRFFDQHLIILPAPIALYHVRTAGPRLTKFCRRIHGYAVVYPRHSPLFPRILGYNKYGTARFRPRLCSFL
jgi:hypothetical protein